MMCLRLPQSRSLIAPGRPSTPSDSMVGLIAAAAALEASNSGLRGLLDGAPRRVARPARQQMDGALGPGCMLTGSAANAAATHRLATADRLSRCQHPRSSLDWGLAGALAIVFGVQKLVRGRARVRVRGPSGKALCCMMQHEPPPPLPPPHCRPCWSLPPPPTQVPTYEHGWYKALKKPEWTPPNYVFPLVWVPLKMLQSAALWLVCKAAPTPQDAALPVALFGLHLFLGNWWNVRKGGDPRMLHDVTWATTDHGWLSIAPARAGWRAVPRDARPLRAADAPLAGCLLWAARDEGQHALDGRLLGEHRRKHRRLFAGELLAMRGKGGGDFLDCRGMSLCWPPDCTSTRPPAPPPARSSPRWPRCCLRPPRCG